MRKARCELVCSIGMMSYSVFLFVSRFSLCIGELRDEHTATPLGSHDQLIISSFSPRVILFSTLCLSFSCFSLILTTSLSKPYGSLGSFKS
jgi:hypothetical protein